MIIPDKCPFCHGIFLNSFFYEKHKNYYSKVCIQINHRFGIGYFEDKVCKISLGLNLNSEVTFNLFNPKNFYIYVSDSKNLEFIVNQRNRKSIPIKIIPYFDPDFSNPPKLINKINTYLTFI